MKPEQVPDVPQEKVPTVVKNYILSGAKKFTAIKQEDGKWTISAE